jgi:general stress protein 26
MIAKPPLDPGVRAEVLEKATSLIRASTTCILVTYRRNGHGRVYGMGYLQEGWLFFMSTFRDMTKAGDLAGNARAMVLIQDPGIRWDHFIQIDTVATELSDEELAPWQETRFKQWPHEIELFASQNRDWVGWTFEPIRLRVNGYINSGPWLETPVVFTRKDLGLPVLEPASTNP